MNIKVDFSPTREDIFRIGKFYYSRIGLSVIRWPLIVIYALAGILFVSGPSVPLGALILLAAAFILVSPRLNAWLLTRNFFSNPTMSGECSYIITDESLKGRSPRGESENHWITFTRWMESNDAFLLIVYKYFFVIVMKKGFQSDADISEFRGFLQSKYGKPAATEGKA